MFICIKQYFLWLYALIPSSSTLYHICFFCFPTRHDRLTLYPAADHRHLTAREHEGKSCHPRHLIPSQPHNPPSELYEHKAHMNLSFYLGLQAVVTLQSSTEAASWAQSVFLPPSFFSLSPESYCCQCYQKMIQCKTYTSLYNSLWLKANFLPISGRFGHRLSNN